MTPVAFVPSPVRGKRSHTQPVCLQGGRFIPPGWTVLQAPFSPDRGVISSGTVMRVAADTVRRGRASLLPGRHRRVPIPFPFRQPQQSAPASVQGCRNAVVVLSPRVARVRPALSGRDSDAAAPCQINSEVRP